MSNIPAPGAAVDTRPDATADFARFLVDTRYEDIPAAAIAATKRSIFDTVGVMLAGSGPNGTARKIVGVLERWGGASEATVIGHAELADDPELASLDGRRKNHDRLDAVIAQWAATMSLNDAVEFLRAAGVPAAPARDGRRIFEHPQIDARG